MPQNERPRGSTPKEITRTFAGVTLAAAQDALNVSRSHLAMTDHHPLRVTKGRDSQRRVRECRKRMKAQGFKEIWVWVPDVNSPESAKAAHEQSLLLAAADRADPSIQDYIDAMTADI